MGACLLVLVGKLNLLRKDKYLFALLFLVQFLIQARQGWKSCHSSPALIPSSDLKPCNIKVAGRELLRSQEMYLILGMSWSSAWENKKSEHAQSIKYKNCKREKRVGFRYGWIWRLWNTVLDELPREGSPRQPPAKREEVWGKKFDLQKISWWVFSFERES